MDEDESEEELRLLPSDPDIQTIVGRIADGSLDLQPDFQRGAVWSKAKQVLLVDSILRDWYVPPVHVVKNEDETQEVLDGQQRLRAIYDFTNGLFPVKGNTEPLDPDISELHGLRYEELPEKYRRRFDRFTLRTFELVDYAPEEPYELFFRLNQPATLTSAEKRNAFFGGARDQIKELTEFAERRGMTPENIGFSNARLAYEDVIARFVWTLDAGSLSAKVTASRITDRYRLSEPFPSAIVEQAKESIDFLFADNGISEQPVRMNKATTYSFLLVAFRHLTNPDLRVNLRQLISLAEASRFMRRGDIEFDDGSESRSTSTLMRIFDDRSTSRVNDTSSVILRDASLWGLATLDGSGFDQLSAPPTFFRLANSEDTFRDVEQDLLRIANELHWELIT